MTRGVRKLERRRSARIAYALDNGWTALLTLISLVAGVGGCVGLLPGHPWWAAAVVAPFLVMCGIWTLVAARGSTDCVIPASDRAKSLLIDARDLWQALPSDLQDKTRPVIDAAYEASALPRDAENQVLTRLSLLRKFADVAAQQQQERAVQTLGTHDLETGEAYLTSLQALRDDTDGAV